MNLSYWEKKTWFSKVDFCIVGSGIVGLNCALRLRDRFPNSKILVLEKGILPQGASTKNAGFACFGSMSEILDDLETLTEEQLFKLVSQRVEGLDLLIHTLGKKGMAYQPHGGYELFLENENELFEQCHAKLDEINELLYPIFQSPIYKVTDQPYAFKGIDSRTFFNKFEAQIDTGKMMQSLLVEAYSQGILILNATEVLSFSEDQENVHVHLNGLDFKANHLLLATNAFATQFADLDVKPARNQVLVTTPIKNLDIKGTFHLHKGYYYFRNIDNRILLGGGRHIDMENETTSVFGLTDKIQVQLEELLRCTILPNQDFEIDMRWSGILGVGPVKEPLVYSLSKRMHIGVRLGGMGVAIGSSIGRQLANLI